MSRWGSIITPKYTLLLHKAIARIRGRSLVVWDNCTDYEVEELEIKFTGRLPEL